MDRKLSDEQVDRLAKTLLRDFAPDDETLDEIAGAPRLWRNVQNRIETEKARRAQSWFAVFRRPVLAFGALALLVGGGLTVLFLNFTETSNPPVAQRNNVQNPTGEALKTPEKLPAAAPQIIPVKPEIVKNPVPEKAPVRNIEPKVKPFAKNQTREFSTKQAGNPSKILTEPAEETKTDFIALSYAANMDSGQIVRVKVPRSMMVSLGLKSNVEKESELVSAEVVIGDDGAARAIRFIR